MRTLGAVVAVYKISSAAAWNEAMAVGVYAGSVDDHRDGYIHLSAIDQVAGTAAKFFAGQSDLLLIAFATASLGASLRWEPSRGGQLFPHVYGTLDPAAALWTSPLPLGDDGRHVLPAALAAR